MTKKITIHPTAVAETWESCPTFCPNCDFNAQVYRRLDEQYQDWRLCLNCQHLFEYADISLNDNIDRRRIRLLREMIKGDGEKYDYLWRESIATGE